jgi:hypothetical protein
MRLLTTLAMCGLVAALALAPSGVDGKTARCPPHGRKVLLINPAAVVYGSSDAPVGCMRPHGRGHRLYDSDEYDSGYALRLAGRFAAFVYTQINPCSKYDMCPTGTPGATTDVEIVDLRSGHGPASSDQDVVGALKLSSLGIAAWTNTAGDGVVSVRTLGPNGEQTLDSGPIDAKSLALHGTTLTWTNAGQTKSATLSR